MLYDHQQKLLSLSPDKHLLAWECGTGKTMAALSIAMTKTDSVLVICPKSLKEQWVEQCGHKILSKEEFKKYASKLPWYKCIIIDEAHYFTGMRGLKKRSQLLKSLMDYIKKHNPKYIYALTATPYMSSPWNIYALAEILGHKINYQKFKDAFFQEVNMGLRWPVPVVKKNIESKIADIVKKIGSTVKMSECWDIPEQIFQTEYFELTKEQIKAIDSIEETSAIVRWTKIHQICGGTLKGDGYVETQYFKSEKKDRILELIEKHKLIAVVCRYNAEINYLYDNIKSKRKWILNGSVKERHEVVREINEKRNGVVFIQASCSEGYGLPHIPIMVFYSYDFSLKNYIQLLGRIQRAGSIKRNVYISLLVKGSIDEDVYRSIQNKEDFQISIYDKS